MILSKNAAHADNVAHIGTVVHIVDGNALTGTGGVDVLIVANVDAYVSGGTGRTVRFPKDQIAGLDLT